MPDDFKAHDLPQAPSLFGSSMRTSMLLSIAVLEETYAAQLARCLKTSISSVQRTLDKLEEQGLVSTRASIFRRITLNPLYPAAKELKAFLLRIAAGYPEYAQMKESIRRRPRRRLKAL